MARVLSPGSARAGTRASSFSYRQLAHRELPNRFSFLREITQFHGAYSSAKARAHVPEFEATIGFESGARDTFADIRRRGAWRDSMADEDYQRLVDKALRIGFDVVEA